WGGVDALPAAVRIRAGFLHVLGGHRSAAPRRHPLPKPGALLYRHVRLLPCPDGRLAVRGRATAGDAEAAAGSAAVAVTHLVRQNDPVLRLVGGTGTVLVARRQTGLRYELGIAAALARSSCPGDFAGGDGTRPRRRRRCPDGGPGGRLRNVVGACPRRGQRLPDGGSGIDARSDEA